MSLWIPKTPVVSISETRDDGICQGDESINLVISLFDSYFISVRIVQNIPCDLSHHSDLIHFDTNVDFQASSEWWKNVIEQTKDRIDYMLWDKFEQKWIAELEQRNLIRYC